MFNVLSTVTPKDEIFDKGYVAPPKVKAGASFKAIDIPDQFIRGSH
jgi:hypothetical protein